MEQFKLTVALNRGIDRSDEMDSPSYFFIPFPSILPPFSLSITAQTLSQLQNSICMLMRKKEASWSQAPFFALSFSHTFLFNTNCFPTSIQGKKGGKHDCWCTISKTQMLTYCSPVKNQSDSVWPPSQETILHCPAVTLLTPGPTDSGLCSLLTTALFDGARLFTYSKGKWETYAELGEM